MDALVDLGIELPPGRYTTLAGAILERIERIPAAGEHLDVNGWRLEVVEASAVAILSVRVHRIAGG